MKKVALITGASSGIGEALALEGASKGYNLSLMARSEENLQRVASACKALGADVSYTTGDVGNPVDCERFVKNSLNHFGAFHILINNAGVSMRALFNDTELSVLHKVMDVNFWGTVNCTKFALPELLKNKGSLVAVSSIAGFKGLPARTGYSASKFAVNGFMESLRCENLHNDLHVLVACPGYTASNIRKSALNAKGIQQAETPLDENKLMSPVEVALEIWKAIERRKRTLLMTLLGKATVFVNKFFPAFVDRRAFEYISKEPDSPFH